MSYPPPPYGPPGYYPYPGPYGPPPRPTNGMAIGALISSLVFPPLGIVLGHIALSQIKRTGEEGRTLAIVGLVIGYVATILTVLFVVFAVLMAVMAADNPRYGTGGYYTQVSAAAPTHSAIL